MLKQAVAAIAMAIATTALAQAPAAPGQTGTVLVMTGLAELELPNDEAIAQFYFETQDPDLVRAQGIVNQRVSEGIAALKKADPKAEIQSAGYSSTAVYSAGSARTLVGWRVRQSVSLRTANIAELPRTVAAAQSMLAVGQVDFRLSRSTRERTQAQLIKQAIANVNARIAAAAEALGVPANRVRLEELNFGGHEGGPVPIGVSRMSAMASDAVPQASFEPGRSMERQTVTGKARLLP
jgi:uncharacterized protein YggE